MPACLPRAYKEEEKKMGTLVSETIERPDSMTTAGVSGSQLSIHKLHRNISPLLFGVV